MDQRNFTKGSGSDIINSASDSNSDEIEIVHENIIQNQSRFPLQTLNQNTFHNYNRNQNYNPQAIKKQPAEVKNLQNPNQTFQIDLNSIENEFLKEMDNLIKNQKSKNHHSKKTKNIALISNNQNNQTQEQHLQYKKNHVQHFAIENENFQRTALRKLIDNTQKIQTLPFKSQSTKTVIPVISPSCLSSAKIQTPVSFTVAIAQPHYNPIPTGKPAAAENSIQPNSSPRCTTPAPVSPRVKGPTSFLSPLRPGVRTKRKHAHGNQNPKQFIKKQCAESAPKQTKIETHNEEIQNAKTPDVSPTTSNPLTEKIEIAAPISPQISNPSPAEDFSFETKWTESSELLKSGRLVDALNTAMELYYRFENAQVFDTQEYLLTTTLITKIYIKQGNGLQCILFLEKVISTLVSLDKSLSFICLISRLNLANVRLHLCHFEEALKDFEFLIIEIKRAAASEIPLNKTFFNDEQIVEILHAKATLLMVVGCYEESADAFEKIRDELEERGKLVKDQIALLQAKVALLFSKIGDLGPANRACDTLLIEYGDKKGETDEYKRIHTIARYAKESCVLKLLAKWRQEFLPNFRGDFVDGLNARGANVFFGLAPTYWAYLFD